MSELQLTPLGISIGKQEVAFAHSFALLKKHATKESLFYKGKLLVIDLFGKLTVRYLIDQTGPDSFAARAEISLRDQWRPLSDCSFIAPCQPAWCLIGHTLKIFSPNVSAQWLRKMPCTLTTKELQELQEEETPCITSFTTPQQVEPLPLLILSDRTGGFATLQMNYGGEKKFAYPPSPLDQTKGRLLPQEVYWEADLLQTGFTRRHEHYYCPLDKVGKSIAFLLELGWTIYDYKNQRVILETARNLSQTIDKGALALRGSLRFDQTEVDITHLRGQLNRHERFISLGEGVVGLMREEGGLTEVLEASELVGETLKLPLTKIGLLEEETKNTFEGFSPDLFPDFSSLTPSAHFQGTLRPYQQKGFQWIYTLFKTGLAGLLADEMGLGKTVQLLAFLSLLEPIDRILIILPTSLLFNWAHEIATFLPSWPVHLYQGTQTLPPEGIVLASYARVRQHQPLFTSHKWRCLFLDEAQQIKNPHSQIAQAIFSLSADFRLSITGTPLENRSQELWSHFYFLLPGLLGPAPLFEQKLQTAQIDFRFARQIQKLIRPFILRRTKEQVAIDLPPLDEQLVFVEMEEAQKTCYDQFLAATKSGLLKKIAIDGKKSHRMELFEALLRLRQITCYPPLVDSSYPPQSGKLEALFIDIEALHAEGKKALIFSQFASMLDVIANQLRLKQIPFCRLDGSTTDRQTPVEQFQNDPLCSCFLITLKAGGVGLNLTAADYVLLFDPWWNEAAEAQAIGRAHRIGQKKPVIARRYVTVESIEERLMAVKAKKKALFTHLLEEEEVPTGIDLEELL